MCTIDRLSDAQLQTVGDMVVDANLVANGIQEMGRLAIADFRRRYPRVPANALDAFASSYTFNNR